LTKILSTINSLRGSLVKHRLPIIEDASTSPGKIIFLNMGSLQKMRQNYWKKSAKTWMCTCCQTEHNNSDMYSIHSSLVKRQLSIRGCGCSSPGKFKIFKLKLGLHPSQDEIAGLHLVPSNKFSGAFRISGAFRKIISR
jgi:hypothetical protein